jgi:hypothetical protein
MVTVTVTDTFEHPVDAVWPVVSDFGGIHKYMRGLEEARVTGDGVGSERALAMAGGEVVERLTWLDHDHRSFSYTIITSPLPVDRYVAAVRLTPDGDRCHITWEGNFEADGVSDDEARTLVTGIYTGGIKGYKKALGAA